MIRESRAVLHAPRAHELSAAQLLRHLPEAAVLADVDSGRVVYLNTAAERLLGYSAEEAQEQSIDALVPGLRHAPGEGSKGSPWRPARRKSGELIPVELVLSHVDALP